MILVYTSIANEDRFLSGRYLALEHQWEGLVFGATPISYRTSADSGGFTKLEFGTITFSPETFEKSWPPPRVLDIEVKWLNTNIDKINEADAVFFFEGECYIENISPEGVTYKLYSGKEFTKKMKNHTFDQSLNDVFTWFCDADRLNLNLNTDNAQDPSPNVHYKDTGHNLVIDTAQKVAEFYTHQFYIEDGTLYLIDMNKNGINQLELPYQHFIDSNIIYNPPLSKLSINGEDDWDSVSTDYPYGEERTYDKLHNNQATALEHLESIKNLVLQPRTTLNVPLGRIASKLPKPGYYIVVEDKDLYKGIIQKFQLDAIAYYLYESYAVLEGYSEILEIPSLKENKYIKRGKQ